MVEYGFGNRRQELVYLESRPVYKRVLLKISGESLAGEKKTGIDFDIVRAVCTAVKTVTEMGVEVGIVVGGGNFWRGVKDGGGKMERTRADHMGMMATVMNALAVSDVFEQMGVPVRVQTAITMVLRDRTKGNIPFVEFRGQFGKIPY